MKQKSGALGALESMKRKRDFAESKISKDGNDPALKKKRATESESANPFQSIEEEEPRKTKGGIWLGKPKKDKITEAEHEEIAIPRADMMPLVGDPARLSSEVAMDEIDFPR